MSATFYALVEPLLVALIVLVSAVVVLRKHTPKLWTRLTGKAGAGSCHDGGATSSCGSACGSCGSAVSGNQPIKLHKARH